MDADKVKKEGGLRGTTIKIIIIAAAVLAIIAILVLIFIKPIGQTTKRETIKIAARSDVIDYFQMRGLTDYLQEESNTIIEWLDYGTLNIAQRVAQDIGKPQSEIPDAYLGLGLTKEELVKIAPDLFRDITDSAMNDTQTFSQIINSDTSRLSEMKIDGKIYSFPTLNENYSLEYPQKAWINADWLLQIDAQVPTTTEELIAVLEQFKATDLNDNGNTSDEIPIALAADYNNYGFGFLINAFVTSDYELNDNFNFNLDDYGRLYAAVTRPEFAEAIKYIQRLFNGGLINEDAFSADTSMFLSGGVNEEIFGVIAAPDPAVLFSNTDRASHYVPLPPLNGGNQATEVRRTAIEIGGYMLSKNTKKSAAALRFGDAMLGMEATLTLLYGPQEFGWGYADSRIASLGGAETSWKLISPIGGTLDITVPMWVDSKLILGQQAVPGNDGSVDLKTAVNWQGYLNQVTREYYEPIGRISLRHFLYNYPEIILSDAQEAELASFGNIRRQIFEYMFTECRRMITENVNIDQEFPTFVEELNNRGLEKFIEIQQQAFDAAIGK